MGFIYFLVLLDLNFLGGGDSSQNNGDELPTTAEKVLRVILTNPNTKLTKLSLNGVVFKMLNGQVGRYNVDSFFLITPSFINFFH